MNKGPRQKKTGTNQNLSKKGAVRKKDSQPAKRRKKRTKNSGRSYLGLIVLFVLLSLITVMIIRNRAAREDRPTDIPEITKVEDAIKHAAVQLGVPDALYRKTVRDDAVHISIVLDPNRVDLVFANMIITGQVELVGGEILTGTESPGGTAHTLRIHDPAKETDYVVRLVYDRQSRYAPKAPMLAIIVDDFGEFAGPLLNDFLATDRNVTFSILPNLRYSGRVMEEAVAMGREVMLHIPMEPVGYPRLNPGENPILVEQSDREINRIIDGYMRQLPQVSGANNHMGSLATADERVMTAVLSSLARHNLYFIDSRTTAHTTAVEIGQRLQIPVGQRDLFLDDPDSSEATVRERLRQLAALKEQKDKVVVITHCFDRQRLDMLNLFIAEAKKMGFEIVPVSRLFISELPEIL